MVNSILSLFDSPGKENNMRDKPQTENKTVQKRKYFQSMEPMTGTNNLFSRENVLFVMLIRRKEADSDICCSSVGPLMFFVVKVFVCK